MCIISIPRQISYIMYSSENAKSNTTRGVQMVVHISHDQQAVCSRYSSAYQGLIQSSEKGGSKSEYPFSLQTELIQGHISLW